MDRPLSILNMVQNASFNLEKLIRSKNYAGYDPYDVKGMDFFMQALAIPRQPWHSNVRRKLTLAPLIYAERFFPRTFRRIVRIKPQVNAKGMGLISKAYFNLYAATKDAQWYNHGQNCLSWLLDNRVPGSPYPCWGYPFNWDSGVVVPANTPNSVATSAAFDAFWEAWVQTGSKDHLRTCMEICDFFLSGLNKTEYHDGTVCFSYTPLEHFEVHNINLMIAHCLLRVGKETGNALYCDWGLRAARFSINEQNDDGSIFYWSKAQNIYNSNHIDHYHSGFEIRAIFGIWQVSGDAGVFDAYRNYYEFYRKKLYDRKNDSIIPKFDVDHIYPINIHACAEAILLSSTLCENDDRALHDLQMIIPWTINKMQMKNGWYRYMIRKIAFWELPSNIVYMRWGQAWIFLALSQAFRALKEFCQNE